jgi:16S rRNA (uracil1498-N3)-methyltransferase
MSDRFFLETAPQDQRAWLEGPQAHHLANVMRAKAGDEVVVFDGQGQEWTARIEQINKRKVELALLGIREIDRESPRRLTLGVALPKGDRQRWLIEKAVELGVASIVPLKTTRGVAQPVEKALARLEKSVIEATKQCGRNRLLEIAPPQSVQEFVQSVSQEATRVFCHPVSDGAANTVAAGTVNWAGEVFAAIGPEGGFTADEYQQASTCGWQMLDLGPRILRIETAALAVATLVQAES